MEGCARVGADAIFRYAVSPKEHNNCLKSQKRQQTAEALASFEISLPRSCFEGAQMIMQEYSREESFHFQWNWCNHFLATSIVEGFRCLKHFVDLLLTILSICCHSHRKIQIGQRQDLIHAFVGVYKYLNGPC